MQSAIDPADLPFPLSVYQARRAEVLLHMSHFFLRYLNLLNQKFDGDLAMAIVLGEISHHNTAHLFSPEKLDNDAVRRVLADPAAWSKMADCNALSLSMATGIPRETVRRKVAELLERGWLVKVGRYGLRITPACGNHFGPDFSIRILSELLRASRMLERILADDGAEGSSAKSRAGRARKRGTPNSTQPASS